MKNLLDETLALRARYDEEPSHSDHVAALALQIFDALRFSLRLDDRVRALLHSAALLHDIGWSQTPDGRGHHKASARLIGEHPWEALASEEIPLVAQIARYHRKSLPLPEHAAYAKLPAGARKLVMQLGGMLRLADGLDRTHTRRVIRVTADASDEAVIFRVQPKGNWDAERAMFDAKKEMLELALKRPVRCEAV